MIGHGCIGMLATFEYVALGLICGAPLYLSPSRRIKLADIPSGLAMISKVLAPGWPWVILYCFYSEVSGLLAGEKDSGYSGFKPPFFPTIDPQLGMKQSLQSLLGTAYHLAVKERGSARLHLPHCKDRLRLGAKGWLASPL